MSAALLAGPVGSVGAGAAALVAGGLGPGADWAGELDRVGAAAAGHDGVRRHAFFNPVDQRRHPVGHRQAAAVNKVAVVHAVHQKQARKLVHVGRPQAVAYAGHVVDRRLVANQAVTRAVVGQQLAPAHLECGQIRVGGVQDARHEVAPGRVGLEVEVRPFVGAGRVVLKEQIVHKREGESTLRWFPFGRVGRVIHQPQRPRGFRAQGLARVPVGTGAASGAGIDRLDGFDLCRGQAAGRIGAGRADQAGWVEFAAPIGGDDAFWVGACRLHSIAEQVDFAVDVPGEVVVVKLAQAPVLFHRQAGKLVSGRAGNDAVEVIRVALG